MKKQPKKKTFSLFMSMEPSSKSTLSIISIQGFFLIIEKRANGGFSFSGKRLLNLFAYTCSFSVQAAMKGASFTKSVDLSNTYTAWGRENFLLNNLSLQNHEILRADCLRFLEEEVGSGATYDVVVIDPPTISRSKKMDQLFDVQEDYPFLLQMLSSCSPRWNALFQYKLSPIRL